MTNTAAPSLATGNRPPATGSEPAVAVLAERLLERRDDLADRALVADAFDDARHDVLVAPGGGIEFLQRACEIAASSGVVIKPAMTSGSATK